MDTFSLIKKVSDYFLTYTRDSFVLGSFKLVAMQLAHWKYDHEEYAHQWYEKQWRHYKNNWEG